MILKLTDPTKFDSVYFTRSFAFLFKLFEISSFLENEFLEIDENEKPVDLVKLNSMVKDINS